MWKLPRWVIRIFIQILCPRYGDGAELTKDTEKLSKAKYRLEVADLDLETYDRGLYPNDVKAVKVPLQSSEYGETLSECQGKEWVFDVKLKAGTTRKQAVEAIHHAAQL